MSLEVKNLYQISREKAGYTQAQVAEIVTNVLQQKDPKKELSARQYARYESISEKVVPPPDVMAILVELYSDRKLGLDHLMETNPVARMILPEGVQRKSHLLEVVTNIMLVASDVMKMSAELQRAVLDNTIDQTEQALWDDFMALNDRMLIAGLEGKCVRIDPKGKPGG